MSKRTYDEMLEKSLSRDIDVEYLLRKCERWRCMPYNIGKLVAPHLCASGFLEEFEHKAQAMQRDIDLLRNRERLADDSMFNEINEIIAIVGLSTERMDFYPLRKAIRDFTYHTWRDNCLQHLHPRRRRLWTWYELEGKCNFGEYVRCGHCERLVIAALGLPDSDYDCAIEYEEAFPGTLYDGTFVENLYDGPYIDEYYDIGEDPPLCADVTVSSLDDRFCWRFFISDCDHCHYKVWPSTSGSHCLACYYFEHVLNELMNKF